jgi:hypothetical protein
MRRCACACCPMPGRCLARTHEGAGRAKTSCLLQPRRHFFVSALVELVAGAAAAGGDACAAWVWAACCFSFLLASWLPTAHPPAAPITPCLPATCPATPPTAAPSRHPFALAAPLAKPRASATIQTVLIFMIAPIFRKDCRSTHCCDILRTLTRELAPHVGRSMTPPMLGMRRAASNRAPLICCGAAMIALHCGKPGID